MEKKISVIIDKIYKDLKKRKTDPDNDSQAYSVLSGEAGCCLFDKYYINYTQNLALFDNLQADVEELATCSLSAKSPAFCGGKSGVNWFFSYLNRVNLLDEENYEIICDDDAQLANVALQLLQVKGKYDFLHGAIGIAYHLLYSRGELYKDFFDAFFIQLSSLINYDNGMPYINDYDILKNEVIPFQVNFGLAHGMPSVVKFCVQCYKQGICRTEAKRIAYLIIELLKYHANRDCSINYYPTVVRFKGDTSEYSRLGWCYGDLGIGIIFYQAAVIFKDAALENHALDVLLKSTERRDFESTKVIDCGICHGTAGVAHIYNKMWHSTNNKVFKEACDYWMQKTIDLAIHEDGIGGFKSYLPPYKTFRKSYNLLEGSSGIGLALISYLTNDFSWDYCLMIND